jgi:exopolysaccharide biosynthesis polyprenyl glycosylphosphotransferase
MRLRSIWRLPVLVYCAADYLCGYASIICAFKLSPRYQYEILNGVRLREEVIGIGYVLPAVIVFALHLAGLQRNRFGLRVMDTLLRAASATAIAIGLFALIYLLWRYELIGRYVLGITFVYSIFLTTGYRVVLWRLALRDSRDVLMVGTSEVCEEIAGLIRTHQIPVRIANLTALSRLNNAVEISPDHRSEPWRKVDEIVIEKPDQLTKPDREFLLNYIASGVRVADLLTFFERTFERVYVPALSESWFWSYDPAHAHPMFFAFKRITDIGLSIVGICFCIPLAPFLALFIKLQDGGPIFYSQVRLGVYNSEFLIYKLRTMVRDAETSGAQWAAKHDDRITWLGRLLRRTRLDEVPQFWNILRGDMSFIGPRPERPEFVEVLERAIPYYKYRHLIKPGLTGWAQVNYPYGASIEDARQKLSYDLYYLKYASVNRDIMIILKTGVAMVKGAR